MTTKLIMAESARNLLKVTAKEEEKKNSGIHPMNVTPSLKNILVFFASLRPPHLVISS